jgi:integrase/recombinase XerD
VEETGTLTLRISPHLLKANTKGKLATRSIPVIEDLRQLLSNYYPIRGDVYLFPGRSNGHLAEDSAARILREACKQVGIIGVSTHSFRRTALTQMSNAGIPLRVIQEISGHRNLEQLQKYMEVSDSQLLGVAATLAILSLEERKCREIYWDSCLYCLEYLSSLYLGRHQREFLEMHLT